MPPPSGLQRKRSAKEILIEKNLVTAEQMAKADAQAATEKKPYQQVLIEQNVLTKSVLLKALSDDWKVKAVDLSQLEIDKEIVQLIPETVARRHTAVPFAKEESILFVAMSDPKDIYVQEDIQTRAGLEVQAYLALPQDVTLALDVAYGKGDAAALNRLVEDVQKSAKATHAAGDTEGIEVQKEEKEDISEVDAGAPEVEKFVNAIILGAMQKKASDIHIEPFEDPTGKNSKVMIRYRVDGMLRPGDFEVPWAYRGAIAAKLKIMTNSMNITERRIPQSGRIQILAKGKPIEFRVEIVPTVFGESTVMRILDRASVRVDIKIMGFLPDTEKRLLDLFKGIGGKKNFGLILVCGPTGSGKSTTLYGCLNYVNRPDIKIITAENPVEYNIDGIIQVPVNPDLKLGEGKKFDFATALRSFMRLDPDVIMVGEIRDEETAHIALEAAMTGHLVFSTIHTNDAPSALERLTQMGLPPFVVANTMKAVLAQRLGRRLCKCKEPSQLTEPEKAVFKANNVKITDKATVFKAKGCEECKDLGFKGRCGFHELLVLDDEIRAQILKDPSAIPVRDLAISKGALRTIVMDGLEKVLMGLTTVKEVLGGQDEEKKPEEKK